MGGNTEKHLVLPSSFPRCINKITPKPSLLQANSSSPLSLSLPKKSSRPSITDMTLHLTLCSISLLCWEVQNLTLHMQPHQCWAESTSFKQLAAVLLTQPRRLPAAFAMAVHYWHTDCCPPVHQATSLQSCLPAGHSPSVISSLMQDPAIPLVGLQNSSQPKSPAWLDTSECKQKHVVYEQLLSVLYHLWTCWGYTVPAFRPLMKMLDSVCPSISFQGTWLMTWLQLDFMSLITNL